jgi:hypothetical protein
MFLDNKTASMRNFNTLLFFLVLVLFSCKGIGDNNNSGKDPAITNVKLGYFSCDSVPMLIHYRTMYQSNEDSVFYLKYCEDSTEWAHSGNTLKSDKKDCREYRIFKKDSAYSFTIIDSSFRTPAEKQYVANVHRVYKVKGNDFRVSKFVLINPSVDERNSIFWEPSLGFLQFRSCDWCEHTKLLQDGVAKELGVLIMKDSVFYSGCK